MYVCICTYFLLNYLKASWKYNANSPPKYFSMNPLKIRAFPYITAIPLMNIGQLKLFFKSNGAAYNQAWIHTHTHFHTRTINIFYTVYYFFHHRSCNDKSSAPILYLEKGPTQDKRSNILFLKSPFQD